MVPEGMRVCLSGSATCTGILPCSGCLQAVAQMALLPALQAFDREVGCASCGKPAARLLTKEALDAFVKAFGENRGVLVQRAVEALASQPQPPPPPAPRAATNGAASSANGHLEPARPERRTTSRRRAPRATSGPTEAVAPVTTSAAENPDKSGETT